MTVGVFAEYLGLRVSTASGWENGDPYAAAGGHAGGAGSGGQAGRRRRPAMPAIRGLSVLAVGVAVLDFVGHPERAQDEAAPERQAARHVIGGDLQGELIQDPQRTAGDGDRPVNLVERRPRALVVAGPVLAGVEEDDVAGGEGGVDFCFEREGGGRVGIPIP
jgi:hypothetical protein